MSIQSQNERGGQVAGLFVRRPVLAVVVNALIIVAGLAAFLGVEVRELPSVEQPVLTVSTSFPGAAALKKLPRLASSWPISGDEPPSEVSTASRHDAFSEFFSAIPARAASASLPLNCPVLNAAWYAT